MWLPLLSNSSTLHSNFTELSTTLWSHNYGICIPFTMSQIIALLSIDPDMRLVPSEDQDRS